MSRNGRRAAGWTTLVAGLGALTAGLVLALNPARAPAGAGVLPQQTVAPAAPSPSLSRPTAPPPPQRAVWTPQKVTIAGLDIAAPVDAIGLAKGVELNVPESPDRLGWWIGSALPGQRRGTVLIAGHVDTARDGKGSLYRLEKLPVGARIEVRAGDQTIEYRVMARRSYAKSRLPKDLFQRDGAPRLALVTCGGTFRNGAYDYNVVVYATPQ